jgi:hypothetical protein
MTYARLTPWAGNIHTLPDSCRVISIGARSAWIFSCTLLINYKQLTINPGICFKLTTCCTTPLSMADLGMPNTTDESSS